MINVRCRLTRATSVWWTGRIVNPQALVALIESGPELGYRTEVFDDDEAALIAAGCFELADLAIEDCARGVLHFGSKDQYRVEVARLPRAAMEALPGESEARQ